MTAATVSTEPLFSLSAQEGMRLVAIATPFGPRGRSCRRLPRALRCRCALHLCTSCRSHLRPASIEVEMLHERSDFQSLLEMSPLSVVRAK